MLAADRRDVPLRNTFEWKGVVTGLPPVSGSDDFVAAMTYRCATCGKPVTVAHYAAWPSECPHCKTAPPTLILRVPS